MSKFGITNPLFPASPTFAQGGGVQPATAQVYDLQFNTQSYRDPSGSDILLGNVASFVSTSDKLAPDVDGKYYNIPAGTPSINGRGLWVRANTRTNLVRNLMSGTAGAVPDGWVFGTTPTGLTRTITSGLNHPVLNLPYTRVRFQGTASANSNVVLKWLNGAAIPADSGYYMSSGHLMFNSGSIPVDGVSKCIDIVDLGGGVGVNGTRLFNRQSGTNEGPQRFKTLVRNNGVRTSAAAGLQIFFKAGTTYDFEIDIIAPQFERVEDAFADASLPILNDATSGGTTAYADDLSIIGGMLTHVNGGAGFMELTTETMSGSGLSHRKDFSLIQINGNVNALKRDANGCIASEVGSVPRTWVSPRVQFGWEKRQAVSWGGGVVTVASSSSADVKTVSGTMPTITSIKLTVDGCIKRIRFGNAAYTNAELTAYQQRSADFLAYGATMGGLHYIGAAIEMGKTGFVMGNYREVVPGGMAAGGLATIDASNPAAYQQSWGRDYLNWGSEYASKATLDNTAMDSDVTSKYCEYLQRKFKIDIHYSSGPNQHLMNWGIDSVETIGSNNNRRISKIFTYRGQQFAALAYADASYEGHLIRKSGCTFTHGREQEVAGVSDYNGKRGTAPALSNGQGRQSAHQITLTGADGPSGILSIDPYVTPGNSASGLIDGVWPDDGKAVGAADTLLQAYCFRMTTTTGTGGSGSGGNWSPMIVQGSPPPGYTASRYEANGRHLAALAAAGSVYDSASSVDATHFNIRLLLGISGSGSKSDINSSGGLSIDGVGRNAGPGWRQIMLDAGIEDPSENFAVATEREQCIYWKWQENYQRGLFYWWAYSGDPRIPAGLAADAAKHGLCNDMYLDHHPDDDIYWNTCLYVREAVRIVGDDVCQGNAIASVSRVCNDTIMISSYARDSHNANRLVYTDGAGKTYIICDGNIQASGVSAAPLSAKWFMPKRADIVNLVVTFCVSVDHMAMGSFRMEMTQAGAGQSLAYIQYLQMAANDNGSLQDFVANHYTDTIKPFLQSKGIPVPTTAVA